jgi:hypothetical protein
MEHGRQFRRVTVRRNGERQSPGADSLQYERQTASAAERRQARFVMIVFGLTFLAACVTFVVMAAGDILG